MEIWFIFLKNNNNTFYKQNYTVSFESWMTNIKWWLDEAYYILILKLSVQSFKVEICQTHDLKGFLFIQFTFLNVHRKMRGLRYICWIKYQNIESSDLQQNRRRAMSNLTVKAWNYRWKGQCFFPQLAKSTWHRANVSFVRSTSLTCTIVNCGLDHGFRPHSVIVFLHFFCGGKLSLAFENCKKAYYTKHANHRNKEESLKGNREKACCKPLNNSFVQAIEWIQ